MGSDPFTQARKEKKDRVQKNTKQQKENLKRIAKVGGKDALPAGLQLVSDLGAGPAKERGTRRRALKEEVSRCPLLPNPGAYPPCPSAPPSLFQWLYTHPEK